MNMRLIYAARLELRAFALSANVGAADAAALVVGHVALALFGRTRACVAFA